MKSECKENSICGQIIKINEFGEAVTNISCNDFTSVGIDFGDTVDILLGDETKIKNVPYFSNYYGKRGQIQIISNNGIIEIGVKYCAFISFYKIIHDEKVFFSLNTKHGRIEEENTYRLVYSDDIADYSTKEAFINARAVTAGKIKKGVLYRSASPFDDTRKRAACVSEYVAAKGINTVINLAQNEEDMKKLFPFMPEYAQKLVKNGQVVAGKLTIDFMSEVFFKELFRLMQRFVDMKPPFLINCLEGKDRTGFVCAVIEALCGATEDEIIDDYMQTYANYFGVGKDSFNYAIIRDTNIIPMLEFLDESFKNNYHAVANWQNAAERYLLRVGLNQFEIEKIRLLLTE